MLASRLFSEDEKSTSTSDELRGCLNSVTKRFDTLEKGQGGETVLKELGEESEKTKKRILRERWKGPRPSKGAEKLSETASTTAVGFPLTY